MKFDTLGDWCKWLEKNFSPETMIPKLPVILRLDGNNFHNWTLGLKRPFDEGLTDLMINTTKFLVKETNARVGYCQSDEITLILYSSDKESSVYNDGKKQKILSKLTGKCVTYFNEMRPRFLPGHEKLANFDCRIYQTPTLEDATLQILWREIDASKNSVSMLARNHYSHNEVEYLNTNQLQDKLFLEKGINWNNLETKFKRGSYVMNKKVSKPFTKEELDSLPEKHNARKNPNLVIERNVLEVVEMPIFSKISNKVGVIFNSEEPILFKDI
jgi:tRNA(His) guanylyltransferase